MAAINWEDSFSVGIKSIDDQHKKLIEMINNFYSHVSKQPDINLIIELVDGMKKYTMTHFITEERYMKQYNYPDYEAHKKEHTDFVSKVNALEEKLKSRTIVVSFEVTSFLKDWIKKHIQNTDKQYTKFFIEHGIS